MSNPGQEIEDFLSTNATNPDMSIEVALHFAAAMCNELRAALREWEDAEAALRQIKEDATTAASN